MQESTIKARPVKRLILFSGLHPARAPNRLPKKAPIRTDIPTNNRSSPAYPGGFLQQEREGDKNTPDQDAGDPKGRTQIARKEACQARVLPSAPPSRFRTHKHLPLSGFFTGSPGMSLGRVKLMMIMSTSEERYLIPFLVIPDIALIFLFCFMPLFSSHLQSCPGYRSRKEGQCTSSKCLLYGVTMLLQ